MEAFQNVLFHLGLYSVAGYYQHSGKNFYLQDLSNFFLILIIQSCFYENQEKTKKLQKGIDIFFLYVRIVQAGKNFAMPEQFLCLAYLTAASITDIRSGRIPNPVTLGFLCAAVLSDILAAPFKIPGHLLSAVFFLAVFSTAALATKGLGTGDVKLATAMGYASGLLKTSIAMIFACAAGVTAFLVLRTLKKEQKQLPFAPFAATGYIACEILCRRIP